jgi:hypothetical protein
MRVPACPLVETAERISRHDDRAIDIVEREDQTQNIRVLSRHFNKIPDKSSRHEDRYCLFEKVESRRAHIVHAFLDLSLERERKVDHIVVKGPTLKHKCAYSPIFEIPERSPDMMLELMY